MDVLPEHLMEVTGRLHAYAISRCRKWPFVTIGWEDGWAPGPVLDAMEASGPQVRSWAPWRRVGPRSGLGRYGGEWAPGPVLGAMEANEPRIRSWTPWRRVSPRSGRGRYGG
jgi:hypothetical protein